MGPTVFGTLFPTLFSTVFITETSTYRDIIANIGLLFFLFIAGLETKSEHLGFRRLRIVWVSLGGIIFPFLLGFLTVLLLGNSILFREQDSLLLLAVFMGIALSISSLPVIARILMDLGLKGDRISFLIMSAASINDIVGWALFGIILRFICQGPVGNYPHTQLVAIPMLIGAIIYIQYINRRLDGRELSGENRSFENLVILSIIIFLICAAGLQLIGINAMFGAFFAGVLLSRKSNINDFLTKSMHTLGTRFFAPLYFVSIGLKLNIALHFNLTLTLLIILAACLGKVGGVYIAARLAKLNRLESLITGVSMNARGVVEILLAAVAFENQLIQEEVYVALIIMALVTTTLSSMVLPALIRRYKVETTKEYLIHIKSQKRSHMVQ